MDKFMLSKYTTNFVDHSLLSNFKIIIKLTNIYIYLVYIGFLFISIGICNYYEILMMSSISTIIEKDIIYFIFYISCAKILNLLLNYILDIIKKRVIYPKIMQEANQYYWTLIEQANPQWLKDTNCIKNRSISNGVSSIKNLIDGLLSLIIPIVNLLSQIAIAIFITGLNGLIVLLAISIIMLLGIKILHFDYINLKKIKKETSDINDNLNHKIDRFFINLLNGRGKKVKREIIDSEIKTKISILNHKTIMSKYYTLLDLLHILLVGISTLYLYKDNQNIDIFVAIFIITNKTCDYAWWLFHSTNNILVMISDWGPIETILKEYQPMNNLPLKTLYYSNILEPFLDNNVREIRLCGASGDGKTSWMINKVINTYRNYYSGQWIYLDQKMKLLKSSKSIKQIMSDYLPKNIQINLDILFEYSIKMNIDNIINYDTINKPFKKPSGGEEKRILILRAIMPILMKVTNIKIIFNDEVTAGLDENNWLLVRKIFTNLKEQFGIRFITIDHHNFDADINLSVKKKIIKKLTVKENIINNENFISKIFCNLYKKEQEKINKEDSQLYVWIPTIESEPLIDFDKYCDIV